VRAEAGEEANTQDGRKRGRRGGKRERERREQQTTEQVGGNQPMNEANGNIAATSSPVSVDHIAAPRSAEPTQASEGLVQVETKASAQVSTAPAASAPYQSRRRSRPREIYTMENKEPLVQIETHTDK
jgi:ribonuclease E